MVTKEELLGMVWPSGSMRSSWQFKELPTGLLYSPNGKLQVWKSAKNSHRFRLPVKYGLYAYSAINENNAAAWEVVHDALEMFP